ncbi:MAG TPA: efflux RND transporter periplasmic adaptor subunit [Gemmataceae bacterium]|nr:efflux RND transporter periplasmic adaptor subunit [Gemmataceae bacterium]
MALQIRSLTYVRGWVLSVAGLALLAGCGRQAAPAEEEPAVAPVKWMEARQMFIEEWTELMGTTQALPDHVARVTAPVEGQVISVLRDAQGRPVAEGQTVKKGDIIVQLDDRIARANRDKAEAAEEEAKQQVLQAEYAIKLAEIELRSKEELSKKSASASLLVSPIDIDRARVALQEAHSKRKAAELHQASGTKELNALNEQLTLYTLTAPLYGRLGRLQVVQGQTLPPGTPVTEIVDLEKEIDVLCFVPPHTAKQLRLGQPARIGGIDDPAAATTPRIEGKVAFIADQAETDTGNFAVKVRFPNTEARLRGSITLRLRVLTTPGRAALTLPESAVMEDQDPAAVLVVEDHKEEKTKEGKDVQKGKARKLRVQLGMRDRVLHLVEILGLDDPEKKWQGTLESALFITEKGQGLRNGDLVKLEVEDEDEEAKN